MENGNEIFEIGQIVFATATTIDINKRAFIKDTIPPLKSITFFYEDKLILDRFTPKVWTFKEFKKYLTEEIESEYEYQKKMKKLCNDLVDENKWNEATDEFINQSISDSKSRVDDMEKKLNLMKQVKNGNETYDIEKIKNIPITNFIQFNRGLFACCPFHGEKTPSLKYYPKTNTCHCFGACGKSFDVIDVFQNLHGLKFREAIYQLNKIYGKNN